MSTLTRTQFNGIARKPTAEEASENVRAVGFFFLLLATASLAWDANIALTGYGVRGLSGILQIWQALDKTSLDVIQQMALVKLGYNFWFNFAQPLMNLPAAALFGVIGLVILRKQSHEIRLRAPSVAEIEMMRQGHNPRGLRRR